MWLEEAKAVAFHPTSENRQHAGAPTDDRAGAPTGNVQEPQLTDPSTHLIRNMAYVQVEGPRTYLEGGFHGETQRETDIGPMGGSTHKQVAEASKCITYGRHHKPNRERDVGDSGAQQPSTIKQPKYEETKTERPKESSRM